MSFDQFLAVLRAFEGHAVEYVLVGLGTAWQFEDLQSERRDFAGVSVRVATPETLYRMKRGTVRPLDHSDAMLLRERFGIGMEADADPEVQ